jgi:hypothetical protein
MPIAFKVDFYFIGGFLGKGARTGVRKLKDIGAGAEKQDTADRADAQQA